MSHFGITPLARADLDAIWDYIAIVNDRPQAAFGQVEMLHEKFYLLASNPLLGERREDLGPGLRAFVAGRYLVVYRPTGEAVEIVRVVDSARDIRRLFRQ